MDLQRKLAELASEFGTKGASANDAGSQAVATQDAKQLQESIDYIRLSIKYVLFDLEATRRENRYLRTMLEQREADDAGSDSDFSDHDDFGFDDDSGFAAS